MQPDQYPAREPRIRKSEQGLWQSKLARAHFLESTEFHRGPVRGPKYRKILPWSLFAAVVDLVLIFGLSMLFVAAAGVFGQTHQGLFTAVIPKAAEMPVAKLLFLLSLASALFAAVYLVVVRSFLGCSLGEWACGLRLGTELDRSSSIYILRVMGRVSLVTLTGVLVIPFLSFVFNQDLAGQISGLSLTMSKD